MDFPSQRRVGAAKYGKNKGKPLGYNFFNDHKTTIESAAPTTTSATRLPLSPLSASSEMQIEHESTIPMARASPSPSPSLSLSARPAHVTTHSSSSVSSDAKSRSGSPVKPPPTSSTRGESYMFDILSSDDEHGTKAPRPPKRRKITQVLKESKPNLVDVGNANASKASRTKRLTQMKKQESEMTAMSGEQSKPQLVSSHVRQAQDADSLPASDTSDGQGLVRPLSKIRSKRSVLSEKTAQSLRTKEVAVNDFEFPINEPEPRPPKRIRTLVKTKTEDAQTPRKQQQQQQQQQHLTDSEASVASPGSIGFNDLRLTPERGSTHQPSPDSVSPAVTPSRRGRLRRIDMLDAPKEFESKPHSRAPSLSGNSSLSKNLGDQQIHLVPQSNIDAPSLSRSGSSQRQTYARGRNTYGKERSHLADMVDGLDDLNDSSSQEASQRFASQLGNSSQPSQLQMELELEDSSGDDAAPGLRLKSIHELRQAGSNDRFDRDLEGLLGDIDPNTKHVSKSSRLTACMKLFSKMSQEGFAVFVSDHGLDRLADWAKMLKDNISKLLLIMILWRLIHAKNTSPTRMRSIFQATVSGTILTTDLGTMQQLSRSRKVNLSKQTIRDLDNFEHKLLSEKLLPAYEGAAIIPTAVMLGALHDSLRRLVEMGTTTISINKTSYKRILLILEEAAQPTDEGGLQNRFVTKLTLSLLHLFSGPLNDDLGLSEEEYLNLGSTLSVITDHAKEKHEDLVQSVFHFAIGVCNGRPDICRSFSTSEVSNSAMTIVCDRFPNLVDTAVANIEVDSVMLDSIILGLTCLIFLAENDSSVRERFAHQTPPTANSAYLETLVNFYIRAAPRLINAATAEKMQALIAQGYLSILICVLCLDDGLREETSQVLNREAFALSDVVASAKELLIHIQALDADQSNLQIDGAVDGSLSSSADGFWARWAAIVEKVRLA